ncbi:unnamed protein product, partial [Rotaria sp. Silwood1]
ISFLQRDIIEISNSSDDIKSSTHFESISEPESANDTSFVSSKSTSKLSDAA